MDFVKRIRDAFTAKTREIDRLTSENHDLKTRNSRLISEVSSLKSENANLQREVKRFHDLTEEIAPTSAVPVGSKYAEPVQRVAPPDVAG